MQRDRARSGEWVAGGAAAPQLWGAAALALALLAGSGASAAPLPPDRPSEFGRGGATPPASPSPPIPPAAADTKPSATPAEPEGSCLDALRKAGVAAEPAPQPSSDNGSCRIETPVRLSAVALPAGAGEVALPDRPVVACRFARPFGDWVGRIAAPVLGAGRGTALTAVRTGPGFACRSRNRQAGEKPSAHGIGLALDISGFEFKDGPALPIKAEGHREADASALGAVRQAACGWFTTILGPGSDPYHGDHLHLDIQLHGSSERYRICQ